MKRNIMTAAAGGGWTPESEATLNVNWPIQDNDLFLTSAGVTPSGYGDPVGYVTMVGGAAPNEPLLQTVASDRPTLGEKDLFGRDSLTFDGTDTLRTTSTVGTGNPLDNGSTWGFSFNRANTGNVGLFQFYLSSNAYISFLLLSTGTLFMICETGGVRIINGQVGASNFFTFGQDYTFIMTIDSDKRTVNLYADGIHFTTVVASGDLLETVSASFYVGPYLTSSKFVGKISDPFTVSSKLENIEEIHGYLSRSA